MRRSSPNRRQSSRQFVKRLDMTSPLNRAPLLRGGIRL